MIPLPLLFEDDHLLIVDKPAGLVVHPAYKNPSGTLLDELGARGWPPGTRPSIVGRLDRVTSGLVIVAKTAEAHARLQRALASGDAEKIYLAVVRGTTPAAGVIDLPLASDPADRRRRAVSPAGAPSVTAFERVDTGADASGTVSRLTCRLVTGRRHQIRVHLAARGWPIVGDATYGTALEGFPRIALHAWRTAFVHPMTGEPLEVEAPLPPDLRAVIDACFGVVF